MDIKKLRKELKKYIEEKNKTFAYMWAGIKRSYNIDKIVGKYNHLWKKNIITNLIKEYRKSEGEQKKSLRNILGLLIFNFIDSKISKIDRQIADIEINSKVKIDGIKISYREAEQMLFIEKDKIKRKKIREAIIPILNELSSLQRQKLVKINSASQSLNYKNYIELYEDVRDINFNNLIKMCKYYLRETDEIYREYLLYYLKPHNILSLKGLKAIDFPPDILPFAKFNKYFLKSKALLIMKKWLKRLGIDLDKQKNVIQLDIEKRPHKSYYHYCDFIEIPNKIFVSINPQVSHNVEYYTVVLHELYGHGEHSLHMNPTLPVEFIAYGDIAIHEGFGFLFDSLLGNRYWLQEIIGMPKNEAVKLSKLETFGWVWIMRDMIARLFYELTILTNPLDKTLMEKYVKIDKDIMLIEPAPHGYLNLWPGERLYCHGYILAFIFASQIRKALNKKFGNKWFTSKKAGDFLKELWSYGGKLSTREMLNKVGYDDIDVKQLIKEIKDILL